MNAGNRRCHSAGPNLWNRLPIQIWNSHTLNQFKSKLKHTSYENCGFGGGGEGYGGGFGGGGKLISLIIFGCYIC